MKTTGFPLNCRALGFAAAALALLTVLPAPARAASTSIAVAANFTVPAKRLAAAFAQKTGDNVVLSFGSSGQFVTEITQGAPYEVFLSADAVRPEKLAAIGLASKSSLFTYAVGKLVLYSAKPGYVDAAGKVLASGKFAHIAIADPKAAPYGAAGIEALKALGLYDTVMSKIVTGKSIAQTYEFIATGNAELGFVALSQVINAKGGSQWLVPAADYQPIVQDAVLLKAGDNDPVAKAFLAYIKSPEALAVIRSYGYATKP
ncbi:molybdate ABC transporter substrate-binding protein [Acidocella sp.]|uniref:molybdate ABC transporter substrate-binding protein n=1 Tax=Acidocella sp. TaxID=50710 RepID=UPI0017A1C59E|nr:molybdate ABC transporter substrate-binding protein [Acidocella sp.]NNM57809.1 molybdate ABC transporter substrate-binding protein [Acidocella sp.]